MLIPKIRFLEGNLNMLMELYRRQHIPPQRPCCCQEPLFTHLKWLLYINAELVYVFTKERKFSLSSVHMLLGMQNF